MKRMTTAIRRLTTVLTGLLIVTATALAQKASLNLTCFPALSVADGHSTVTITAEVRDLGGSFVRDGTPVVFETDKGQFRSKNVVETQNGFARAILTSPGLAGTAKVRASVFSLNASATLEVDFVNDRTLLDTAKEVVELTGKDGVTYSQSEKVLEAKGANQTAILRYRDVEIKAEDLQLKIPTYEVRARGAQLTIGKSVSQYRELYFKLNLRKGLGLIATVRQVPVFVHTGVGAYPILTEVTNLQALDVSSFGPKPHEGDLNLSSLSYLDTTASMSTVESKRAVVSPGRNVQFQKASVRIGGQTVMSLPLFQVDLNSSTPIITEQFLNVSNSSLAVNYPYYLSLKPGETSALRFRYGNRYSSGLGATGGTYLDYEYNWNRGAKMEGGLALTGLNRGDWGVNLRQFWSPDTRTSVSALVDVPAHKSLFTNLGISRRFDGFQGTFTAQHGRSLGGGDRFQSDQLMLNLDGDPIAVGKLPLNLNLGLTAQQQSLRGDGASSQQGAGLQARLDSRSLLVSPRDSLSFSYTATRWLGNSVESPLTQVGSVNLTSNWIPGLYLQTTYEYGQDGFTENVLGRHRLSMDGLYAMGKFNIRSYVSKSLDVDRLSANLGLDYKLSNTWRLSTGYLLDRYLGDTFVEQTFILGYRLGFREIGLSYSTRTKRLGLELLGTRFN